MTAEPVAVTLLVIAVLDDLSVRYTIGGSLASATGRSRSRFALSWASNGWRHVDRVTISDRT